jgi:membrane-bound ClpP family serine protease
MIIIGAILLVLGFVTGIGILWILGIVALVIGLILALAGGIGHPVGPRRYYW